MVVGEMVQEVELAVIGGGPGGYTAALRAAELGIKTLLIDAAPKPGGVCLHMGCIPSKALLHAAEVIDSSKHAAKIGISFGAPKIDVDALRTWKTGVIDKLSQGIVGMCKSAGVEILHGKATFQDSRSVRVDCPGESAMRIKFKHCILATGSRPVKLPKLFKNEEDINSDKVLDSTTALNLADIPKKLIVIGGGYIGLELGTVYAALGSEVTVVEMTEGLLPGADRDLVRPLANKLGESFKAIHLNTKVNNITVTKSGVEVEVTGKDVPEKLTADKVLISVGRRPNSDGIGLEATQVEIDQFGFVLSDETCRTRDKRIFSIGDISGQPMLAHRAIRQAYVAAEVLAGKPSAYDNRCVPAVVFTEPEVAWCGLTETEAKAKNISFSTAKFPWSASGRAMTIADTNGTTKVLFDPNTSLVLGVGIVGPRAGDLISEAVVAIEMGAVLEDLAVAIHPHPTLSETLNEAAMSALSRLDRQAKKDSEKQISST
ncbi:dihydrolipoyl dehydrogenase [bacterium]|jgi:dihydrolipoamide dehydrogenase|nr:dihydrolipoyl dehydrogenase [bacterium]MBP9811008.1 dihydrolipoyl dehydrogenase [bacterium]